MKKIEIEYTGTFEMSYDENSENFKEALESYIEVIDKNGTEKSMLKHVAFHVNRFGIDKMVEGVGYVCLAGTKEPQEPFSGIYIEDEYDECEFEVIG